VTQYALPFYEPNSRLILGAVFARIKPLQFFGCVVIFNSIFSEIECFGVFVVKGSH